MSAAVSDIIYSTVKITLKVMLFIFKTIFITIPLEIYRLLKK